MVKVVLIVLDDGNELLGEQEAPFYVGLSL